MISLKNFILFQILLYNGRLPYILASDTLLDTSSHVQNGGEIKKIEFEDFGPTGISSDIEVIDYSDIMISEFNHSNYKQSNFLLEWTQQSKNFTITTHLTFNLNSKADEYFYYDISPNNTNNILIGYFCSDNSESDIHVIITNPDSKKIFNKIGCDGVYSNQIYSPEAQQAIKHHRIPGTYTIIFSNSKWHHNKQITLLVAKDIVNKSILNKREFNYFSTTISTIDNALNSVVTETQYLWTKTKNHLATIINTSTKLVYFSIAQLITLLIATVSQVYYLKKMISPKS
ncbi:uncharacterized protein CMU_011650 [Cryptosporidium muris RN66]|uniref:GOLD domain-containing protein n=1 Tax=Cryptosporidium muris (strain RN66) TaxID=441375 RepID=B6AJ23_CRYMR|nr:uncharacterized protein CMU_011650 [Cryptosporidium muris RN66]EEA08214.1 hypothetical protein, conserved [Cryptosporidium muris RN66]|eukprot:XP_002142563.1 hypothetical protein [Cryptosporidium muris RN66]